jgi:hypothetical protein
MLGHLVRIPWLSGASVELTLVIGVLDLNKGEAPFEINFLANALKNNAASRYFLFPENVSRVTHEAGIDCLNWTLSS